MIEAMQARRRATWPVLPACSRNTAPVPGWRPAEEALALSIEAAVARGDESARSFAAQYLKRYPGGRFRDQAERALQSTRGDAIRWCPA
jgi:hypothetical protein